MAAHGDIGLPPHKPKLISVAPAMMVPEPSSDFRANLDNQYQNGYRLVGMAFGGFNLVDGILWMAGGHSPTHSMWDAFSFLAAAVFLLFAALAHHFRGHVEDLGLILAAVALSISLSGMAYAPQMVRSADFLVIAMALGFGFRSHGRYALAVAGLLVSWVIACFGFAPTDFHRYWMVSMGSALTMSVAMHVFLSKMIARMERLNEHDQALMREKDELLRCLAEAQAKIEGLLEARVDLLENLPAWSAAVAEDLRQTLKADLIEVFQMEHGAVNALASVEHGQVPRLVELEAALKEPSSSLERFFVPIRGLSGELRGALHVKGLPASEQIRARHLLQGFAFQVGNAIEMLQVRQRLVLAEAHRAANLEELHVNGVETLRECPRCGRCFAHTLEVCEEDGAELETLMVLPLRFLNRYRLIRRLGRGGMGTVYLARDEKIARDVAIKIMRAEHFHDQNARLRFERETQAMVKVNHPGVVMVLDSGETPDGSLFIVMEVLKGIDLGALLRLFGPGSPGQVARLVRQGAEALRAAHDAGIIHRDIKPANLFLVPSSTEFQVKLLDFGLALSMAGDSRLTQTGFLIGTPSYMAPEQVLGMPVTVQTDLYAFALVAFEALVGHLPVPRRTMGETLHAILHETPPAASGLFPGLPPEIDDAFARALAKEPADRPQDLLSWAFHLADRLEREKGGPDGWPKVSLAPMATSPESETRIS